MQNRLDFKKASRGAYDTLRSTGEYLEKCGLEKSLMELVKIRASQINGCAHCLDLHVHRAKALGEIEQRIVLLDAWREANVYTARERAALEWTEALTRIDLGHVPDEVYDTANQNFTEKDLVDLSLTILLINDYNRLNIAFRTTVQPNQSIVAQKAPIEN